MEGRRKGEENEWKKTGRGILVLLFRHFEPCLRDRVMVMGRKQAYT